MQIPRSLGIIGHGAFGSFLARIAKRFAPDLEVRIYDREITPDGQAFRTIEDVCQADVVVIAVSIRAFEEVLSRIVPLLKPDAILVDVNTVKVHPANLLRKKAGAIRYITTHPMFGPFSFEKKGATLEGLKLVVADHTLPDAAMESVCAWLKHFGLNVVQMTAESHDRLLAETLFLTHYIAQAVARAGFVRTDIDTLSFGFLMDAVESVKNDVDLFRDVFFFNPYCEDIIVRFERAEWELHALLDGRQRTA